jgi:transcriptional regulator with XRE-family HTH domain
MTITREQIKAARAMLDWSQKVLAEQCRDVSEPTIKLLETGRVRSTETTLSAIRQTLETAGIEFLAQNGVRFRDDLLTVIEPKEDGDNPYLRLMEDVYHTTRGKFGEILFSFVDQSLSPDDVVQQQMMIRKSGTSMRFLVRNGDTYLRYPPDEYRYLPKGFFLNNSTVIYGEKVAFFANQTSTAIIIRDKSIAEIQRMQFNLIWDMGEIPGRSTLMVAHG